MNALDLAGIHRARDLSFAVVLVAAFASVPMWADKGMVFVASMALTNIVFALSFNLIFGLTGLVSFGHAAFFAAGAYATGFLLRANELPFLACFALGGLAGAVFAALVALVALRRSSGVYFAVLTLALAELLRMVIAKSSHLGREDGMTGIVRPVVDLGVARIDLAAGDSLYFVTLLLSVAMVGVLYLLWHNRLGRLLAALRQDSERLRFLGVNVHAMRFLAFVLSGLFAGFAGALHAPAAQLLTPELAHWSHSALPILFCLVGGVSRFWGPVVGAIVFMGLEHFTRGIVGLSDVVVGAVLLGVVLMFPGGLLGGVHALAARWRRPARTAAIEPTVRAGVTP